MVSFLLPFVRRSGASRVARTLAAATTIGATGCRAGDPSSNRTERPAAGAARAVTTPVSATPAPPVATGVVDSLIPIPELLRRFRVGLEPAPTGLEHAAPSRDVLVRRFVRAVEAQDTAAIRDLVLSRREFAYLYYPSSPLAQRPYEEPPALLWFQLSEGSNKGIVRVLRRLGGRSLGVLSYHCEPSPTRQGDNRLWQRCAVRRVRAPGDTVEARLFGSVVERGGRFKFVSYANDL